MKYKKLLFTFLTILVIVLLSVFNTLYSNPRQLKAREMVISSEKLDKALNGITIEFFSDLHIGFSEPDVIERFFRYSREFDADVILFGGDLFDDLSSYAFEENEKNDLIESFASLKPRLGKYAVLGEKDLKNENVRAETVEILVESGFTILNNSNVQIHSGKNSYFNIVGIDSLIGGNPDIPLAFDGTNSSFYTFVLTHCPDTFDSLNKDDCDYVLSGHSHGSQIYIPLFEIFYREKGAEKYSHGKSSEKGVTLDITNGVGLSNKKARLMADSEIVFYRLESPDQ